ncbi:MAG: hypothetical protein LBG80_15935 [Bacteroidales bacterium]|nr:hypothetical protein [Bacteroidales bacterium]
MKIENEINAGIACSDRANEVEHRPNEKNSNQHDGVVGFILRYFITHNS